MNDYESIPIKVQAWQAPVSLTVRLGDLDTVVQPGEWVIYDQGGRPEQVISNVTFQKHYRQPHRCATSPALYGPLFPRAQAIGTR
jgi:hypothetical protein